MKFSYKAVGRDGANISATIDAADATEAMDNLRRQGIFVSEIAQASEAAVKASDPTKGKVSGGKRLKHLVNFTRQIAVLVASGTPLVQALTALERQAMDKQWRGVLERKYYVKGVGNVRTITVKGGSEEEHLVSIKR